MTFDMLRLLTRLLLRPYKQKRSPSKTVAIVVPLSTRTELLPEEEVSLCHLLHFLSGYDKYFVAPPGGFIPHDGFNVVHFHPKFFGSAAAHNQLLMWPGFYRAFENYKYILIYHLDSLVLSDKILQWCQAGFDYIGAPWLPCSDTPWVKEARVGNGGFTLMKVEAVLKVLYNRYRKDPATYSLDTLRRNSSWLRPLFGLVGKLHRFFPKSRIVNRLLYEWRKIENPAAYGCNNDFFWSFDAQHYLPEFKVASVEEGLRFAFEGAPRMCFELNKRKLPFGCHAWAKYDRAFWEPHLLAHGSLS
jgi:hypothetical protein